MDPTSNSLQELLGNCPPGETLSPQFVTLSAIEIVTGLDAPRDTPPRTFSLPLVTPPPNATNTPQVPPDQAEDQDQEKEEGDRPNQPPKAKTVKSKDDGSCTLEEFWYTEGKDWNVTLSRDEIKMRGKKRTGMASCHTAPECHTCGTKLNLEELISATPCRVCGCFN